MTESRQTAMALNDATYASKLSDYFFCFRAPFPLPRPLPLCIQSGGLYGCVCDKGFLDAFAPLFVFEDGLDALEFLEFFELSFEENVARLRELEA